MSVYQLAIALVLASCMACQVPPFTEECIHDAYPPQSSQKLPTYVINLDLPPEQRWVAVIKKYKPAITELLQDFKNLTRAFFGDTFFKLVDKYLPFLAETLPQPFLGEMKGISVASNIPLGEVTFYNIFYEIFSVCTSIIAEDIQGKLYHGRNLDFGLMLGWDIKNNTWTVTETLRRLVFQADFQRGGKTVFKSVNFAGYVGTITGIRPQAFTLSFDERFIPKGGYIGILEWILGYRKGSWVGFLARQVVENETSYISAQKTLAKSPVLSPVYFILGGNSSGQGCIITRGLTDFDILPLGKQNSSWFLVQTNYDHWKEPPVFDDRRTPAIRCMNNMTQASSGLPGMFNVLSSKPVLNKLTTYTALMQVNEGLLESYLQDCSDPCWPW